MKEGMFIIQGQDSGEVRQQDKNKSQFLKLFKKIKKPITYHCSRHTFATMMLSLGADIYTVGKLLGHTSIKSTQVYVDVLLETKTEAISQLDKIFG